MNRAVITKADNGYIVEITKFDLLKNRPEVTVFVANDLNGAIEIVKKA